MLPFGRIAYQCFFRPLGSIRRSIVEGGPFEQWKTERGRREMEEAAARLPAQSAPAGSSPVELHLLTGRRFWYQTAFCLHSFASTSRLPVLAHIYDDGSLNDTAIAGLQRLGIDVHIHRHAELCATLDERLPVARFPYLRDRWVHFPIIRKLIATHLLGVPQGWKLVLDSDVLFFREPSLILNWLRQPDRPIYILDIENSYGYSDSLLSSMVRSPIPLRVNAGLYGLRSENIEWSWLESVCRRLIEAEGPHYYLEQALLALLLAGHECIVAPACDYVTLPRGAEAREGRAVMHHYVAESKKHYFRSNWRRSIASKP